MQQKIVFLNKENFKSLWIIVFDFKGNSFGSKVSKMISKSLGLR